MKEQNQTLAIVEGGKVDFLQKEKKGKVSSRPMGVGPKDPSLFFYGFIDCGPDKDVHPCAVGLVGWTSDRYLGCF